MPQQPGRWQLATWTLYTSFLITITHSKLFDKCSLARTLLNQHNLDIDQVRTWVCIAIHQSNLNTAVVNYDANGIGYHGMYQISDQFWCGPGNVCNLDCDRLRDDDLHDDFACISQIFAEHSRLSGNGYSAWSTYERNCASGQRAPSIDECFGNQIHSVIAPMVGPTSSHRVDVIDKVYDRCELARELRYVHGLPSDQIATWVCIAKHESNFRTSVVGRLNADGSGDHGLFQISDIYWCSPPGNGWACGVTCAELTDSDITDDVKCIRTIHAEHERLSGDGFNAWAVYQPYCKHRSSQFIDGCFAAGELEKTHHPVIETKKHIKPSVGKVYSRCELALELSVRHSIPRDQIATWVCIAYHESRYNTSAEGRLNADGSGDHGLFQISDIYWCSPPGMGWVCGVSCNALKDNDITDDVNCMRKIYAEHQRLSGDGFNAWSVYQPYCRGRSDEYARGCFDKSSGSPNAIDYKVPKQPTVTQSPSSLVVTKPSRGKVFQRCELARELRYLHGIPKDQIATWVCIAKHESHFNTSAVGRLNVDGSGDHGIFQISDIYWCSPPGKGWACGLSCSQLEDSDITDDVKCMRKIYDEHTRISGDGFNAWTVYAPYCRGRSSQYTEGCFDEPAIPWEEENEIDYSPTQIVPQNAIRGQGKIFERCELATELRFKHHIPMEQIATWVCIAKYESSYNTSAIGRLNADGSADHGLFQISDIYWCSPPGSGWVCGLSCAQLEDSDITDDIECMKKIYEEHQRLSGDGFNAWSVYQPYCRGQSEQYIDGCFVKSGHDHRDSIVSNTKVPTGKVYSRCELATELKSKHRVPIEHIATWVCIAEHESQFNTSAVGRLNADGSADHGMFQISDLFWCSHTGKGGACEIQCKDLENNDITDDVECIRMIWEEHRRLSGDGFNAWVVYPLYCNNGRSEEYINDCKMNAGLASSSTTKAPAIKPKTTKPNSHYVNELHYPLPTQTSRKTNKPSTTSKLTTTISTTPKTTLSHSTTRAYKTTHLSTSLPSVTKRATQSSKTSSKSTTQSSVINNKPITNRLTNLSSTTTTTTTTTTKTPSHTFKIPTTTTKATTTKPVPSPSTSTAKPYNPKTTISNTRQPSSTIISAPVILTLPHMLNAHPKYRTVRGLSPNHAKHLTFVDIEPYTGVPLRGGKRVQFNMFVRRIDHIDLTQNLQTHLMPIMWVDEGIDLNDRSIKLLNDQLFNYLYMADVLTFAMMIGGTVILVVLLVWFLYQRQRANKVYAFK